MAKILVEHGANLDPQDKVLIFFDVLIFDVLFGVSIGVSKTSREVVLNI